jgi:hypothetical protein
MPHMVESNNNNSHKNKKKNDDEVLTLCLSAGRERVIVSCPARTTTVAQLHEQALTALQLGAATACNGNDSKSISISAPNTTADIELHVDCFPQPRRTLTTQDVEWMRTQSLHDVGIRRQGSYIGNDKDGDNDPRRNTTDCSYDEKSECRVLPAKAEETSRNCGYRILCCGKQQQEEEA